MVAAADQRRRGRRRKARVGGATRVGQSRRRNASRPESAAHSPCAWERAQKGESPAPAPALTSQIFLTSHIFLTCVHRRLPLLVKYSSLVTYS